MGELGALLAAAYLRERALLLLVLSIAALLALSFLFAGYTVWLRVRHELRERRWRQLTARWEAPLLDALLDPAAAPAVHAAVDRGERLRFVRFVLEYSRRVKGEERAFLRKLVLPYLDPIAERAGSPRVEVRTRAIQTLGTLGLPRYAGEVLAALDDPSPLVAMVAARSLCREEYPEYAPAVLRRLGRFDAWSRSFMASMLASVGPEASRALRDTLGDEAQAPLARAVAADALRMLKDFGSGDLAARIVEAEDDAELLAAALRLLTTVGRPEHAELIRVRCASPDFAVRASAVSALGTLGLEDDHGRLLGAMSDASPWVAIQAARGLVSAGARALLEDLGDSDHPRATLARQILLEEGGEG
ncbi:MAG TPA: HEAT repeat domain-containing protein [Longimicrobiales bacterium]|nr:HEAT repeat domain-containing protein [Longimicrobiales bacterium]